MSDDKNPESGNTADQKPEVPPNNNTNPTPSIRDDMVEKAVRFLLDKKVRRTSVEDRRKFLEKKGLTIEEIDAAFKLADLQIPQLDLIEKNYPQSDNLPEEVPISYTNIVNQNQGTNTWRDRAQFLVLAGGATYVTFKLIKNYVMPRWFGAKTKNEQQLQTMLDGLCEVQNSLKFLVDSCLQTLQVVQKQQEISNKLLEQLTNNRDDRYIVHAINDLKNEISTVKSLLLSRDQFPPIPIPKPIAYPAWQMNRINDIDQQEKQSELRRQISQESVNNEEQESFSNSSAELEHHEQKMTPV